MKDLRFPRCFRSAMLAVLTVVVAACSGKVSANGSGTGGQTSGFDAGNGGTGRTTAGATAGMGSTTTSDATAGTTGSATTGTIGTTTGIDPNACQGAADPRLVVAPQRMLRLTLQEVVNSVGSIVGMAAADRLLSSGKYNIGAETDMAFPPLDANREGVQIDDNKFATLDPMAADVAQYVYDNFTASTNCATPATDDCVSTYINTFAERAYRRPLDPDEQSTLTAFYTKMRNGADDGNGGLVTYTPEEATQWTVYAILSTPQLLYRSEIGNSSMPSAVPPGIPLTQYELASDLSFFLTNAPPDATLLAEAAAGTLTTNLAAQVDRLLETPQAQTWIRTVMYTFYGMNFLSNAPIDTTKFPAWTPDLFNDERTEAQKFLDNVLWNGNLTDLLTSTTTFLNANLASTIYQVPVPAGATDTTFVQTSLPPDQRSGLLTNAAFLMTTARTERPSILVRGKAIRRTMTCVPTAAPPDDIVPEEGPFIMALASQTDQQQAAARAAKPECASCHDSMDPYGLVLDSYDNLSRVWTIDALGMPVDSHATLPSEIGGGAARNVFDLVQKLTAGPVFTNCMAQTVLQYALTDIYSSPVKLPSLPNAPYDAACAVSDVATRYNSAPTKTFSDMIRAAAASPAFALRTPAP